MSFENFFWTKRSVFKTVENTAKKAVKEHTIDVKITWVSHYKKFKSDTCIWTPTWSPEEPIMNEKFIIADDDDDEVFIKKSDTTYMWLYNQWPKLSKKTKIRNRIGQFLL